VKDKVKGDYSPEAHAELPSTAPDTPSIPYLSNKTKTAFLVKWNVSLLILILNKILQNP